jgi:hypothetical protein
MLTWKSTAFISLARKSSTLSLSSISFWPLRWSHSDVSASICSTSSARMDRV